MVRLFIVSIFKQITKRWHRPSQIGGQLDRKKRKSQLTAPWTDLTNLRWWNNLCQTFYRQISQNHYAFGYLQCLKIRPQSPSSIHFCSTLVLKYFTSWKKYFIRTCTCTCIYTSFINFHRHCKHFNPSKEFMRDPRRTSSPEYWSSRPHRIFFSINVTNNKCNKMYYTKLIIWNVNTHV